MKRCLLPLGAGLIASLLMAGSVAAQSLHLPTPSRYTLRAGDVRAPLRYAGSSTLSSSDVSNGAGMIEANMAANGFVTGYSTLFEQHGIVNERDATHATGLIFVDDAVLGYGNAAGAHAEFRQLVKAIPHYSGFRAFHMMAFAHVGQESTGWSYAARYYTAMTTVDVLLFRQKNYIGVFLATGRAMTLGRQDRAVTDLAKIVAGRIATGG